jgi:hypothetical protein
VRGATGAAVTRTGVASGVMAISGGVVGERGLGPLMQVPAARTAPFKLSAVEVPSKLAETTRTNEVFKNQGKAPCVSSQ